MLENFHARIARLDREGSREEEGYPSSRIRRSYLNDEATFYVV